MEAVMRRAVWVALGVAAVVSSAEALRSGAASAGDYRRAMTRAQFAEAMSAINASFAAQNALCDARDSADRELCRAEAAGTDLIRRAEAEADFRRSADAARRAQRARIEARYLVDRARCGTLTVVRKKDQCLIDAHATRGRALLEAAGPYEDLASS
jgi:hypothetical protein